MISLTSQLRLLNIDSTSFVLRLSNEGFECYYETQSGTQGEAEMFSLSTNETKSTSYHSRCDSSLTCISARGFRRTCHAKDVNGRGESVARVISHAMIRNKGSRNGN